MTTQRAGIHLCIEKLCRPIEQRADMSGKPVRCRWSEAANFTNQPEYLWTAGRQAEHRSDHRLDAGPTRTRSTQRCLEGSRELGRAAVDHRVEQGFLAGVPIENRLLANTKTSSQLVERGRVVSPCAETHERGVENALSGIGSTRLSQSRLRHVGTVAVSPRLSLPFGRQLTVISQNLAGKRIAVTGSTGFLGTAIVERLLRTAPDSEIVCIVRPSRKFDPLQRVQREVIRNDCFDRLRDELGGAFDAEVERRVRAIGGDVGQDDLGLDEEGRAILGSCDIVIHSAATVSFDSPIDLAVEVNLLGPKRVAEAIRAGGGNAHLVAVSTAYVAGNRRGEAFEELVTDTWYSPDVDWRAEVDAARRALADAENESRQLERLEELWKKARGELGAAGTPLLAERSERLREDWVKQRLVDQGKARARSLGWPDVYAYTKALGERALLEARGDVPVSFVRPSIIESALEQPVPGWIRGFRMAEPIFIGMGRGLLKSFPGLPEGNIDVIPVDQVVSTICAVAANGPDEQPSVYQIASGTRKPLRYRNLVELTIEWYRENPLYDSDGQPIHVPDWTFPRRGKVQRQLDNAIKLLNVSESLLQRLPLRGKGAEISSQLEERRTLAERAAGYVEIYGAYTECEARFRIDRTLALFESLPPEDREAFGFDPNAIDWRHYLHDIHLPSIIAQGRVRTKPVKKKAVDRASSSRRNVLSPHRQMAAFDLENTLIRSNVVESFTWLATRHLSSTERARLILRKLPTAPQMALLDRRDRGDFLRHFYRWYAGAPADRLRADAWDLVSDLLLRKAFPDGLRRVREHREAGHRTLLITGALDIVVEPLRPLFDDIVCARMTEQDGRFTGELEDPPPVGEARALVIKDYADRHRLDLNECVAYADSASDLPMLEAVGHAVAVNPETRLAAIARRRGWHVEQWRKDSDTPLVPLAPYTRLMSGRQ